MPRSRLRVVMHCLLDEPHQITGHRKTNLPTLVLGETSFAYRVSQGVRHEMSELKKSARKRELPMFTLIKSKRGKQFFLFLKNSRSIQQPFHPEKRLSPDTRKK